MVRRVQVSQTERRFSLQIHCSFGAPKVFQRPYCCCPSWPRNGGFCLCVGSSSVSLCLCPLSRSIFVSLSLSVRQLSATCLIYSPFLNIDFQNRVCINGSTRRLVNVMKIKQAPVDSSLFGCDSCSQKIAKLELHHSMSRHNVKVNKIHFNICFPCFVKTQMSFRIKHTAYARFSTANISIS